MKANRRFSSKKFPRRSVGPRIPKALAKEVDLAYGKEDASEQLEDDVEMTKRFQPLNKLQSRKERRKAAKLEKKKRIAYFHQLKYGRKPDSTDSADSADSVEAVNTGTAKRKREDSNDESEPPAKKQKKSESKKSKILTPEEAEKRRLEQLIKDDEEDDRLMRELERKLGIRGGKKSIAPEFDFILAGITAGKRKLRDVVNEKQRSASSHYDPTALLQADENVDDFLQYLEEVRNSMESGETNQDEDDEYMKLLENAGKDLSDVEESDEMQPEDDVDGSQDEIDNEDFEASEDVEGEDEEIPSEDNDEDDNSENGNGDNDGNEDDDMPPDTEDGMQIDDEDGKPSDEADQKESQDEDVDATSSASLKSLSSSGGKYIPPHLRAKAGLAEDADLIRQVRGLLNKLSEGNLIQIAEMVEELFKNKTRSSVIQAISNHIIEDCIISVGAAQVLTTTLVYSALLTYLHIVIGTDVGGFIVEKLALEFQKRYKLGEVAVCKNLLLMFIYLYGFKVVHPLIIYGIAEMLAQSFQEADLDLLLLLIKNCGASIRAEDPGALKDLISQLNKKAAEERAKSTGSSNVGLSRVDYMLEVVADLKTNKLKLQESNMTTGVERVKKSLDTILRIRFKTIPRPEQLRITWNDLVNNTNKGRWWLVGSPFAMPSDLKTGSDVKTESSQKSLLSDFDTQVLKLAAAQRMNTDVRRAIFCAIVTSDDYLDAFEKLMRLKLSNKQDREIVNVLVHCCQAEKNYNPFYGHLATKLCSLNSTFRVIFKFVLWEKLKTLDTLSVPKITALAKLYAELFMQQVLSLAYLKVVNFATLDAKTVIFFRRLFGTMFLEYDQSKVEQLFLRLGAMHSSSKDNHSLDNLKQGLAVFFMQSLHSKNEDPTTFEKLEAVAKLARKAMMQATML